MGVVNNSVIGGLAEWTQYYWLLRLSDYGCPITANFPITPFDYNSAEQLVKYKVAYAPIAFVKIVMAIIK